VGGEMWVPFLPGTASYRRSRSWRRSSPAHSPAPLRPTCCCRQRAGDVDAALHSKDTSFEVQVSSK
jgi:hypothetical protein